MQGAILEVDLERMERSILSDCLFVFAVILNSRWRAQLLGTLAKLKCASVSGDFFSDKLLWQKRRELGAGRTQNFFVGDRCESLFFSR